MLTSVIAAALSDSELIELYNSCHNELKKRGLSATINPLTHLEEQQIKSPAFPFNLPDNLPPYPPSSKIRRQSTRDTLSRLLGGCSDLDKEEVAIKISRRDNGGAVTHCAIVPISYYTSGFSDHWPTTLICIEASDVKWKAN